MAKVVKKTGSGGRWEKNLTAVLCGLVASVVLSELLVLAIFGELPKFPRHVVEAPWGLRYNHPGARYTHKSADGTWSFCINGQGMRADRDDTFQKPTGVRRILNLGDSFVIGFEVDVEQTFSNILQRKLDDAGLQVEVLNAGVSGYSNAEALLYLKRELIRYQPDLVIMSFWWNDPMDNVRSDLFRPQGDSLIEGKKNYIPMGTVANFLNTNRLFNILSERSNAFVFLKSAVTGILKNWMGHSAEQTLKISDSLMNTDNEGKGVLKQSRL